MTHETTEALTKRPRVTRADVAREAGTSVAVISYVVNSGPRPVSEATRARVLDAIERTGYRPNGIAKALAAGESGTYGLVVPDVSNPFFAALAYALEKQTEASGKVLILGNSAQSREREMEIIDKFVEQQVDGLLYVGAEHHSGLDVMHDSGTPVVILDRIPDDSPAASVTVDNAAGARVATEHLLWHGFDRIGLVTGPPELSTSADRQAGWSAALQGAGQTPRKQDVFTGAFSREGGLAAGRALFAGGSELRAVFVASDQMALGVVRAAREAGKSVPKDLAVVTFDGTSDTEYFQPRLTTIVQPLDLIAARAIGLLNAQIADASRIICPFEFVVGESCGCEAIA